MKQTTRCFYVISDRPLSNLINFMGSVDKEDLYKKIKNKKPIILRYSSYNEVAIIQLKNYNFDITKKEGYYQCYATTKTIDIILEEYEKTKNLCEKCIYKYKYMLHGMCDEYFNKDIINEKR